MENKKIFEEDEKYKLYRTMYEIIHPTISKKNISNYKIVINDELSPLRIFYPSKVSSLKSAIIYIHGDANITGCGGFYSEICSDIAKKCDKLVIALDYTDEAKYKFPSTLNRCYETIKSLYDELEKNGIKKDKIVLIGDSIGGNICAAISLLAKEKKEFKISKEVLIYPILGDNSDNEVDEINLFAQKYINKFFNSYVTDKKDFDNKLVFPVKNDNYNNIPDTFVVVGKADFLRHDAIKYYNNLKEKNKNTKLLELTFATHGFLNSNDQEIMNEFYSKLIKFLK